MLERVPARAVEQIGSRRCSLCSAQVAAVLCLLALPPGVPAQTGARCCACSRGGCGGLWPQLHPPPRMASCSRHFPCCPPFQVAAVVVGFDRNINYYKIQYATLCIRENPGCMFIATNLGGLRVPSAACLIGWSLAGMARWPVHRWAGTLAACSSPSTWV